jgi:iron complex transport system substrate-binding protein
MRINRIASAVIAGAAGLTLLAGCAGGGGDEAGATSSTETRTVTDAAGDEVEVPTDPQSIVTLHYAATETLMDLDLPPVGQGALGQESTIPEDWVDQLKDIPSVAQDEPDLEKVAEASPDLILAPNVYDDDMIEKLQEIAPVYQFTLRGGSRADWKGRVHEVADAVNRTDDIDQLDDEFEAEQKRIGDECADVTKGVTIGAVSSFDDNTAFLWGSENMLGSLLQPLGFDWSADEDKAVKEYATVQEGNKSGKPEPEAEISLEVLDRSLSDADIIFVNSDLRGGYDELTEALMDSAVFKELPAVKAGHVYPIGKATIAGYADAEYGLDLAEKAIKEYQKG